MNSAFFFYSLCNISNFYHFKNNYILRLLNLFLFFLIKIQLQILRKRENLLNPLHLNVSLRNSDQHMNRRIDNFTPFSLLYSLSRHVVK